jgi:hypothetical protein
MTDIHRQDTLTSQMSEVATGLADISDRINTEKFWRRKFIVFIVIGTTALLVAAVVIAVLGVKIDKTTRSTNGFADAISVEQECQNPKTPCGAQRALDQAKIDLERLQRSEKVLNDAISRINGNTTAIVVSMQAEIDDLRSRIVSLQRQVANLTAAVNTRIASEQEPIADPPVTTPVPSVTSPLTIPTPTVTTVPPPLLCQLLGLGCK